MKNLFIFTFLLSMGGMLEAQVISGVITDGTTGIALPLATIQLMPSGSGTSTDQSGHFSFENVSPGDYEVVVSFLGYYSMNKSLVVDAERTYRLTFNLIPSVISANEIVVTGTRTERKLEDVPLRLELVSPKIFLETPAIDMTGYLKQVPGVGVFNPGGFISHRNNVVMRGMSGVNQARVLVLLDGIPINKADGGSVHWNMFQPEQIQRVEITKGPGSSLYGGNALGGVINIISRFPQNRLQGFVKAEYGSLNTYGGRFNVSGSSAGDKGRGLYYSLNGYYRQSDGYVNLALEDETGDYLPKPDTASTTIKNDMKEYGVDIKSGFIFNPNNKIEVSLSYYNDQRGTGYKFYEPDGSSNDHDSYSGTISYVGKVGKAHLNASAWFRNEDYRKVNDSNSDSKYYIVKSDRQDIGMQFHGTLPTGRASALTTGFDIKNGSVDAVDDYQRVADKVFNMGKMNSFALFAQEEIKAFDDKLILIGGVRLDHARYYDGAYFIEDATSATSILQDLEDHNQDENSWNAISPRLSIQYRITPDIRVYTAYSNGFRPSVLDDLCRSGFVRGGFKRANPLLEPEKINSYEIGGDLHVSKFTLSPSIYYSKGHDFMYYVSTGDTILQGSRLRPVRQVENIGEVEIKGFEIKMNIDILSNLSAYLNYNYNESIITKFDPIYSAQSEDITGLYLTYVPMSQLAAGIGWRNPVVNAGISYNYKGNHYADDLNTVKVDPFSTIDVRLWRSFGRIAARLDIENVFDNVALIDDGTINFGRFTRIEISWNF